MSALKNFLKSSHFLTITLSLTLCLLIFNSLTEPDGNAVLGNAKASVPPVATSSALPSPAVTATLATSDKYQEFQGTIRAGESLVRAFSKQDVPSPARQIFIETFGKRLDFKNLQPGEHFALTLDQEGRMVRGEFQVNPYTSYTATPDAQGYTVNRDAVRLEVRTVAIDGRITSSLFAAFPDDLKSPQLVYAFADIFAAKIDFNTETREGDRFCLLVDEYYRAGRFIGYGPILAAGYAKSDGDTLEAFRFSPDGKKFSYYDAEGRELGASFIRSPVPIARVSSRFSYHRLHPILGVVREHLGVDLAAPTGTPIMAAADGKVIFIGRNGGFGNQIILAHPGDYRTHYGHLSRFKAGLRTGSLVRQKQIIGYVGATGLATGPHLDYRIEHHGVFKNPFAMKFQPKSRLTGSKLLALDGLATERQLDFRNAEATRVIKVGEVTVGDDTQLALL